jgi:hypothetical protein
MKGWGLADMPKGGLGDGKMESNSPMADTNPVEKSFLIFAAAG